MLHVYITEFLVRAYQVRMVYIVTQQAQLYYHPECSSTFSQINIPDLQKYHQMQYSLPSTMA